METTMPDLAYGSAEQLVVLGSSCGPLASLPLAIPAYRG